MHHEEHLHEHGDAGKDATDVEDVLGVVIIGGRGVYGKPPSGEKLKSSSDYNHIDGVL